MPSSMPRPPSHDGHPLLSFLPANPSPYLIPTVSFLIQLLLIAYGEYQDTHFEIKYTDVDYRVFGDAVGLIWNGRRGDAAQGEMENIAQGWLTRKMGWNIGDPYNRSTFRYTPLLPLLLSPMALSRSSAAVTSRPIWWRDLVPWHLFGKVIFSIAGSYAVHGLLMSGSIKCPKEVQPVSDQVITPERDEIPQIKVERHFITKSPQLHPKPRNWLAPTLLWTFNPIILNINTRGSSESILVLLVLSCLVALKRSHLSERSSPEVSSQAGVVDKEATSNASRVDLRWTAAARALWAISIGWKVYPIIYGASIWAWMYVTEKDAEDQRGSGARIAQGPVRPAGVINWWKGLVTTEMCVFGGAAVGSFVVITFGLWSIWGYPFLYHSYIYHIHRLDHRHNFSPYFYPIYLSLYSSDPDLAGSPRMALVPSIIRSIARHPLAAFVPQASATLLAGLVVPLRSGRMAGKGRSRDQGARPGLEFAWFVQTWLFVMFNKVCTSQYFLWFIFLLPPILPRLHMSSRKATLLASMWIGSQGLWLSIAYRLEFLGQSVFLPLWGAGIGFLVVNAYIVGELLTSYD